MTAAGPMRDINTYELELNRLANFDGGFDFIGKAPLQRIKEAGVSHKQVGLAFDVLLPAQFAFNPARR
jgi:glycine cleavage system aminomethyltransferase T